MAAGTVTEGVEYGPQDHTYLHLDTPAYPMHWAILLRLGKGRSATWTRSASGSPNVPAGTTCSGPRWSAGAGASRRW